MVWRLLTETGGSAAHHMAADEALSISARTGMGPPTLRLYRWTRPAITIGYFQSIEKEVNLPFCRSQGIDVVRRLTGGRAILHDPDELTYSFSTPFSKPFPKGLHASYVLISQALMTALERVGIPAEMTCSRKALLRSDRNPVCFQALSYGEVSVNGRKVIGSAQKRWPDGLTQQGSIPLTIRHDLLFKVLRFSSPEAEESARSGADQKMAGLRNFKPHLSLPELESAIRKGFEYHFNVTLEPGGLNSHEQDIQGTLYRDRYESGSWNFMR